jgi:hypothetical protein
MSHIRKAHSVEIIDRRLRDAEGAGNGVDAMELVGLHDELARVERKWIGKRDQARPGGRPLSDAGQLDARFDRLRRLVEVALRQPGDDAGSAERRLLRGVAVALAWREPLGGECTA